MNEELKEIIRKYESILRIEDWKKPDYFALTPFSINLIKIGNFKYKRKEMEDLTQFLIDKKMGYYSRITTLETVVRRKTMDDIENIDTRKIVWMMIDKNLSMEDKEGLFTQIFFGKYGLKEGKKCLEKMIYAYEKKINPEMEKIKQELNQTENQTRKEFLEEVYENHKQLTSTIYTWKIPQIIKKAEELTKKHK
ncbi:MAG: hypothetical protein QW404_03610 [Candidatus Nanoarchaeia archaeon]